MSVNIRRKLADLAELLTIHNGLLLNDFFRVGVEGG